MRRAKFPESNSIRLVTALKKAQSELWPDVSSLLVATHLLTSPHTVQALNFIMRVRRKLKSVDTVKAQSLDEVRKPNLGHIIPIIADTGWTRFLLSFCCTGCETDLSFDLDLGPYFTRHRYGRTSPFGALQLHHQSSRLSQHSSSDMSRLQVPLQRGETETVQRSRLDHAAYRPLRLDGGS